MLSVDRILLATTLREQGALASRTLQLAQAVGAELHVVHVQDPSGPACSAAEVASWVRQQADSLSAYPEVPLVCRVLQGRNPAEAIHAYAEAHAVRLLAVGAPQRERERPGVSTAHQLIRHTMLPVLVCPATASGKGIEALMAPVDFSKPARHACLHAHALAELFGARLDVVHAMRGVVDPEAMDLAAAALRSSVDSFCSDALGADAEVHVAVRAGDPAASIVAAAHERASDLIVLQTHGLAGLSRVALGSVAKRVLHGAPCAVLMLRTFGHALFQAPVRQHEVVEAVA